MNAVLLANPLARQGSKPLNLPATRVDLRDTDAVCRHFDAPLWIVQGGDGTLHRLLSHLPANVAPPPIAVLPAGTTNMTARDLNPTRGLRACAIRARHAAGQANSGKPLHESHRPLLEIRDGAATHYGWFFAMGAVPDAIRAFHQTEGARGLVPLNLARAMLGALRGRRLGVPTTFDGGEDTHACDLHTLMCTTLERLLFNSTPYWNASAGRMHVTWIDARELARSGRSLLRDALRLLRGDGAALPAAYHSGDRDCVRLGFQGAYTIDGELYEAQDSALTVRYSDRFRWILL